MLTDRFTTVVYMYGIYVFAIFRTFNHQLDTLGAGFGIYFTTIELTRIYLSTHRHSKIILFEVACLLGMFSCLTRHLPDEIVIFITMGLDGVVWSIALALGGEPNESMLGKFITAGLAVDLLVYLKGEMYPDDNDLRNVYKGGMLVTQDISFLLLIVLFSLGRQKINDSEMMEKKSDQVLPKTVPYKDRQPLTMTLVRLFCGALLQNICIWSSFRLMDTVFARGEITCLWGVVAVLNTLVQFLARRNVDPKTQPLVHLLGWLCCISMVFMVGNIEDTPTAGLVTGAFQVALCFYTVAPKIFTADYASFKARACVNVLSGVASIPLFVLTSDNFPLLYCVAALCFCLSYKYN